MIRTVFYSWQSDLANSTNRGFIQDSIERATKQLKNSNDFKLEITIDKDTQQETGTPDIADTIFRKIEHTKVFFADISIINNSSEGRKTPNPNVLLELGYAAKALGWERVICFFNTDYGSLEDLPFDIRCRRIISYGLQQEKAEVRKKIVTQIVENIKYLEKKGMLDDELSDYIKVQVDTQLLTIVSFMNKILYGYTNESFQEYTQMVLDLNREKLKAILQKRKFIGFQVFKCYDEIVMEIEKIIDKINSYNYFNREIVANLIRICKWIERFDKFNFCRTFPDLFTYTNKKVIGINAVYGPDINPTNKDGFILLKELDKEHSVVIDFGKIIGVNNLRYMEYYVYLNDKYLEDYVQIMYDGIQLINTWVDITGGEFIIDNIKNFEIKPRREKLKVQKENSKEILETILNHGIKIKYSHTVSLNALRYLIQSILATGETFKDSKEILESINNQIVGVMCADNSMIVEKDKVHELIDEGAEDRIRRIDFSIGKIFVESDLLKAFNEIDYYMEYTQENSKIQAILNKIKKDIYSNLSNCLVDTLKEFLASSNEQKQIDCYSVIDIFNSTRIYHEKDINELKGEVRKLLINTEKNDFDERR